MALTLSEAIDEFMAYRKGANFKVSTLRANQAALSLFLREIGNLQVRHLDVRHGEQFQAYLTGKGYAANTVNAHICGLRAFVAWLHVRRYLPAGSNPTATTRHLAAKPRKKIYVPRKDFARLLDAAPTPCERIVTALGLFLFLRQSEVKTLRIGDVDLDRQEITVTVHKGEGQIDVMPICEELADELRRWLTWYANDAQANLDPSWYLIPARRRPTFVKGENGTMVSVWREHGNLKPKAVMSQPHKLVQRTLRAYGMDLPVGEGNHTLRRSGALAFFEECLENPGEVRDGVLREVQAMMHHQSAQTTEIYLGLKADTERRNARIKGKRMFAVPDSENVVTLRRQGTTDE